MTKDEIFGKKAKPSEVSVSDGSRFVGSVFLYMFIALAITSIVAAISGYLLQDLVYGSGDSTKLDGFYTLLIISLVLYIPTMIWIRVSAFRSGKGLEPAFVIYSIIMGVFISTFTAFLPFQDIAISFGLTCLSFGIMALIAWNSKRNLSFLAVLGSGLLFGSMLILLANFILFLIFGAIDVLFAIVSFMIFFAVLLLTVVDLRHIKQIANEGGASRNVALLCAFNLYVDFIYVFIRVLRIISYLKRR